jgi:hypothetical protein
VAHPGYGTRSGFAIQPTCVARGAVNVDLRHGQGHGMTMTASMRHVGRNRKGHWGARLASQSGCHLSTETIAEPEDAAVAPVLRDGGRSTRLT